MKRTLTLGIILVLLLACVGAVSAAINLVNQGSFEDPILGDVGFKECPPGSLTGWTVGGSGIDHISNYWPASEGIQSVDLSQLSSGTISQILTTPNGKYDLSFDMAGNPECGPIDKKVEVFWGGVSQGTFTFTTTGRPGPGVWETKGINGGVLQASTGSTELTFEDKSTPASACGVALDNVIVTQHDDVIPTPEFPTMALPVALIVGMLGAVLFIRRSKEN